MKNYKSLTLLCLVALLTLSCFEDIDDVAAESSDVKDFVWKGMNIFYLYKDEVPNLANDRFSSNAEYTAFLNEAESPKALFESLIYQPETVDRFSWFIEDYIVQEQAFQGNTLTNGMEFGLFAAPNSNTEGIGVIRLVLPDGPADNQGLKRGDIFYGIDGNRLTNANINALLSQDTYTLNLGFYNDKGTIDTADDSVDPLDQDVTITKIQYTENPVFTSKIFNVGGENVGYLMYNGFTVGSDAELNSVFGDFKSNNVQHLILDLRYNPGGRVSVATSLVSMITGQYTGDVFQRLIFNSTLQGENIDYTFNDALSNGEAINSLGLSKMYVLATGRSASASEGLINGLTPYMSDVIHIGSNTVGKTQASRTLYDSPDFQKAGANPSHTNAMQPVIANGVNKNNEAVPGTGLPPSIGYEYDENPLNYGVLGDPEEPMLALALADIESSTGKAAIIKSQASPTLKLMMDSNDLSPLEGGMVIE